MADIVNLRQFRKRRARGQAAEKAEQNRVNFGRSKSERQRAELDNTRARNFIDGHKRADEAARRSDREPSDPER